MTMLRGPQISGYIGGKSTHNTRIERMWRECNNDAMDSFRLTFKFLEELGMLNHHDNIDMWSLHRARTSLMQKELDGFKEYHNNHPIRTAHGKTPNQICTMSALQDQLISATFSNESSSLLHDWQNIWHETEVTHINVPAIGDYDLTQHQLHEVEACINQTVDPKVKYANIRMHLRNLFY